MRPKQPSATSPFFFDNIHFEHFDKNVNHESRLKLCRNAQNGDCRKKGTSCRRPQAKIWHLGEQENRTLSLSRAITPLDKTRMKTKMRKLDNKNSNHVLVFLGSKFHSSDQKLRNFRPRYLTKSIIIREYLKLGRISPIAFESFSRGKHHVDASRTKSLEVQPGVCRSSPPFLTNLPFQDVPKW